ncbi:MAG: hypothetical protein Q7U99_00145 [Rubrivivax sp.]|nr:hypothetical protein [Rubrivivax sp.]
MNPLAQRATVAAADRVGVKMGVSSDGLAQFHIPLPVSLNGLIEVKVLGKCLAQVLPLSEPAGKRTRATSMPGWSPAQLGDGNVQVAGVRVTVTSGVLETAGARIRLRRRQCEGAAAASLTGTPFRGSREALGDDTSSCRTHRRCRSEP